MSKKLYLVEHKHQGINKNFLVMANSVLEAEKVVIDHLEGKHNTDRRSEVW